MRRNTGCSVRGCNVRHAAFYEAGGSTWLLCETHQTRMGAAVGRIAESILRTGHAGPWSGAETVIVEWTVAKGVEAYRAFRDFREDLDPTEQGFRGERLYRGVVDAPTDSDLYLNIGAWDRQDDFYRALPQAQRGVAPDRQDFEVADRRRIWLAAPPPN